MIYYLSLERKAWRERAKILKRDVYALYLCSRHPRTPLCAKALAILIISYALSPIDLMPDFVPVLGYLDDLILIPAGITLLLRMIPDDELQECRQEAEKNPPAKKIRSLIGGAFIVCIWLLAIYATFRLIAHLTGT
ncbi:MAG TPA: hypothetical protein DCR97_13455 [Deltaproteobacteria bacterium]|nr:hypothetical protein [Deltaproteobacteria bacterium]